MDNELPTDENSNDPYSGPLEYVKGQLATCPDCKSLNELCAVCRIEMNRRLEMVQRHGWIYRLKQTDLTPDSDEYGPWLSEELNHELSLCAYNALCNGVRIETAFEQNFKIQWIQTELARIGYKPESTDEPLSIKNGPRPQWMGSASELAYLLTELIEGNHLTPPPNGRKVGKEGNRAAVADALYDAIEIRDPATNEIVTREYFKSLLRPNSPDRGTFRKLFKIDRRQ